MTGAGASLAASWSRRATSGGNGHRVRVPARCGIDVAVDLAERDATMVALRDAEPDVVIHAAACTDVDGIEREPWRGERSNAQATQNVADASKDAGAYLIAVSTDMVFPGDGGAPYAEDAPTAPVSAYGWSKLKAEHAVLEAASGFAVARTAWLYGGAGKLSADRPDRSARPRRHGSCRRRIRQSNLCRRPGRGACALASRRGEGVFHLVNGRRASRFTLARETARIAGFDPQQVTPISTKCVSRAVSASGATPC